MRQLLLIMLLSLSVLFSPAALRAQTEPRLLPPAQESTESTPLDAETLATYHLMFTVGGTLAAAAVTALLIDGWIVETMTLDGLTAAQASAIVAELESEGGFEAAAVLLSAVLGGIGGQQLGLWLFPDASPAPLAPGSDHRVQPTLWTPVGTRLHVPF